MDIALKYHYTYFLYPYIIEKESLQEYLSRLFKNPKCKLHLFEKEKDFNLYSYFSFNARTCMFQSFEFNKENIRDIEKMDIKEKVQVLRKIPVLIFDYETPENIQGKAEDDELRNIFPDK